MGNCPQCGRAYARTVKVVSFARSGRDNRKRLEPCGHIVIDRKGVLYALASAIPREERKQ